MKKITLERVAGHRRRTHHRKSRRHVGFMLSAVVIFATYAMILPASALGNKVFCGIEEHTHAEECYSTMLICEWATHEHGEECQAVERRELICTLTETPDQPAVIHTHTDSCFQQERKLVCTLTEAPDQPAVIHTHADACFAETKELTCGREESAGHVHGGECVQKEKTLTCSNAEEGHVHGDTCYQTTEKVVCGKKEGEGAHAHTEDCYTVKQSQTCPYGENQVLQEAIPGHAHADGCYETVQTKLCAYEENQVLQEAIPGHAHTDGCYAVTLETQCPAPEHVHTEECYGQTLVCEIPEHTHWKACYSNPKADREGPRVWRKSVRGAKLTGNWAEDLVAIAETQLGVRESRRNYIVDGNGKVSGYTRYGHWAGMPYEEWCAMFVSFCLEYANVPKYEVPQSSGCGKWIRALRNKGLYLSRANADPKPGDIIFFDRDDDDRADHVGIVASVSEDTIETIEGNSAKRVRRREYNIDSRKILGYGVMPENPDYIPPTEAPDAESAEPVAMTDATVEQGD